MTYQLGYFIVSILFLAVWWRLFWKNKEIRKPMLILSLLTMLAGPLSEYWYFQDYWRPYLIVRLPLIGGIEDLLFGFAIGGIGSFIYEAIFIKGFCLCERKKIARREFLLLFPLFIFASLLIFNNLLGINSIFASSIGMIIAGTLTLLYRRDLWQNALFSGILVALIMFVIYLIPQLIFPKAHEFLPKAWLLYGTDLGYLIFGHIPLTEMIWGFSWGFAWGPFYEFITGARIIKLNIKK